MAYAQKKKRPPGVREAAGRVVRDDYRRGAASPDRVVVVVVVVRVVVFRLMRETSTGRVCRVKPGRIMFELDGIPANLAKEAFLLGAAKLPIRTKVVTRLGEGA